jgi:hypothetical protein
MSGTGGAGVFGANGADLSVYSGVDLGFSLSGASDTGMTFSASLDMGGGQTLDVGDFELDDQFGSMEITNADGTTSTATGFGTDTNTTVTIGVSGVTIELSQDGVDDLYDDDIAGDIGISGAMGDLTYSVVTGLEDADPTSLSIGYSAGAISGSVATSDQGDASTVSVSYAMGDITIGVEADTDRTGADTNTTSVSYAMGDGMTISVEESEGVVEASVAYSSGAISVGVTADDAATESWEATMAYDLGGGATFNLGTNQDETTFAGVGFSF